MGIEKYVNRDYIILNGVKRDNICKFCQNQDSNWRAKMNNVKLYCADFMPIPEFVLEEFKKKGEQPSQGNAKSVT